MARFLQTLLGRKSRSPRRPLRGNQQGQVHMTVALDPTTLQIVRVIPGPVSKVFDAWLVREEWQAWIGPEGIQCEVPELDPRVGGGYRVVMNLPNGAVMDVNGA